MSFFTPNTPPPLPITANAPSGIGGWLILPSIGVVVSPFRIAANFFTEAQAFDFSIMGQLWTFTPGIAVLSYAVFWWI